MEKINGIKKVEEKIKAILRKANITFRKMPVRGGALLKSFFAGRKKASAILLLLAGFHLMGLPAFSQTVFDFTGMVKLFLSLYASKNQEGPYFYHQSGDFAFKRIESRLTLKAKVSDNVSAGIRLDAFASPDALFSGKNFPEAGVLASPGQTEPFELSLYEAYVKINHFLLKNLDLTVGKQRIQWGTADKLNVVDNLNPLDFANFLTFDPDYYLERRPQIALNFEYYPSKNSKLQFVWLPSRQYSPLPSGFSEMLKANLSDLPQPEINLNAETSALKNTNYGLRFSTILAKVDVGLSYYRGNYSFPYIQGVELSNPIEPSSSQVYFKYPEKQVLGIDLSGELESIGWWAEVARIQPESVSAWLDSYLFMGGQFIPVVQRFTLMKKFYWQWIIGADYTFSIADGLYLNLQYLHGLFDEAAFSAQARTYFGLRQGMWFGQLQDYLAGRAELRLLKSDLKLSLNSLVSLNSNEATKASAILYPSVEYKIHDAFYFQGGGIVSFGDKEMSKFGSFSHDRIVYLMTKVSF